MKDPLFQALSGRATADAMLEGSTIRDLERRAFDEGVQGLLYYTATASGRRLSEDQQIPLARAYRSTAAANLAAILEAASLVEDLGSAGVEVLLMPGVSLLPLYPDVGCRPMDDIDVFVRAEDLTVFQGVLRSRGYRQPQRHDDMFAGSRAVIDVHTDLLNSGRIRARRHAGRMDPDEVWRDSRVAVIEGQAFRVMSHEDALLYTAVHALRHSFGRLNWIIDLELLLRENLNWDAVEDKGRRYGLLRPLVYGLNALEGLNPGHLPDRAAEQVRRFSLGAVEKRLLRCLLRERPHSEWGQVLWAFNCSGLWRRGLFLAEYLFPRPAVLLQVYPRLPGSMAILVYALRLGQIVARLSAHVVCRVRRQLSSHPVTESGA